MLRNMGKLWKTSAAGELEINTSKFLSPPKFRSPIDEDLKEAINVLVIKIKE